VTAGEHCRRLERMYLGAPTNAYYRPAIAISEGRARVEVAVREEFFHAAGAAHGSIYFKVLDDAAFFAANSLVEDVFVLTVSFHLHFVRPVSSGTIVATGCVAEASRRLLVAEAQAWDAAGRRIALGSGTFVRSRIALGPALGYS